MSEIESVTVRLLKPIQNGETQITELTFREAVVGDLVDAAACVTDMERIAMVMAACCGTPLETFRKVKASDLKNIMKQVGHMVGNDI